MTCRDFIVTKLSGDQACLSFVNGTVVIAFPNADWFTSAIFVNCVTFHTLLVFSSLVLLINKVFDPEGLLG
jgi:hypothetical protein